MLGHAAIAETALADVGGVLQVATAEMSGISSGSSVGVGELVGVASMSSAFSQQTEVSTKVSGVNGRWFNGVAPTRSRRQIYERSNTVGIIDVTYKCTQLWP